MVEQIGDRRGIMFFISSLMSGGNIGVTDTNDGVEEFYTMDELSNIVKSHNIRIEGFIYTGSFWKTRVKTADIVALEQMRLGDFFLLHRDGFKDEWVMYLGETGECNHCYLDLKGDTHVLSTRYLLKNKGTVLRGEIDSDSKLKLINILRRNFPAKALQCGL